MKVALLPLGFFLILFPVLSQANDDLVGIRSLYVSVEDLPDPAKLANLTRVSLETLVHEKLERSGIPIRKAPIGLQVIINAMEIKSQSMVFGCSVNLVEMVRPTSRSVNAFSDPIQSNTWTRSRLGVSPRKLFPHDVKTCVAQLVDRFLTEYRAANSKN